MKKETERRAEKEEEEAEKEKGEERRKAMRTVAETERDKRVDEGWSDDDKDQGLDGRYC